MTMLKILSLAGFIALSALTVVSCSGSGGGGTGSGSGDSSTSAPPTGASVGSCYAVDKASICIDYTGNYWRDNPGTAKLNCDGQYGNSDAIYYNAPCPVNAPFSANLIGTCVQNMEQTMEVFIRYFNIGGAGYDAADFDWNWLKTMCEAAGQTWVWGDATR